MIIFKFNLTKTNYISKIAKIIIKNYVREPVGNNLLKRAMNRCEYGSKYY